MSKVKVLITQPNGKEKLVKAFKENDIELISPKGSYVKPDLIIPVVDEELSSFAYLKPFFNQNGTKVMVSSQETIDTCRDKAEFYRFCRRHNFNVVTTMQDELIAKPRFGKGSRGIVRLDRSYVVQPIMKDPEFSIDYFSDWEGNTLSIIPRYRKNVVDGTSQSMELIKNADLTEVTRLGQELRLIGHSVIQGFYVNKEFVFTEVNCRFGGGSWLTFPLFDSPKWLIQNL